MKVSKSLGTFVLALAALVASRADAGYNGIVAFGDSLTDTGNVFTATGGTYPTPPYSNGRFSNGRLWIETLADGLGIAAPTPALLGGTNYAFANAETGVDPGGTVSGVPNLDVQIGMYLASKPTITADQLFVVWGGANDLLHQNDRDPARSVANLLAEITALAQAGAREFLVPNLPQLGFTPAIRAFGPAAAGQFNLLTRDFNLRLAAGLGQLAPLLGITIHQLDVDGVFQQILANPGQFGIVNITDPAKAGPTGLPGTVVANPNGYLFWDDVHPTEAVHALIGRGGLSALAVPEPSSLLLVGVGLAGCTLLISAKGRKSANP